MNHQDQMQEFQRQGEMLANRVKKKYKHLKKKFARENIDIFRLYDWDIPEIRAVVDWYAGHLVVGEYTRRQSVPEWLPVMGQSVAEKLGVSEDKLHLKIRYYGLKNGKRYKRMQNTNKKIVMNERDLKFYVNPYDFVDTGLFSDHRNTRQMIRSMAKGKDFLNLYCYTGSFTCYAALGGARSTVSVDRSETVINWAGENLKLNNITEGDHALIQKPTFTYLKNAKKKGNQFDLAVVDPPSFSTARMSKDSFDIVRDHPELLSGVVSLMRQGGIIFFSTNHQQFVPDMDHLPVSSIREITGETIPEDYESKRKKIHRCWKIVV